MASPEIIAPATRTKAENHAQGEFCPPYQQFVAMLVWAMLNLDEVRELLGQLNLSDDEAERIRDNCRVWAELVFDAMEYSGPSWEMEDESDDDTPNVIK